MVLNPTSRHKVVCKSFSEFNLAENNLHWLLTLNISDISLTTVYWMMLILIELLLILNHTSRHKVRPICLRELTC